MADGGYIYVLTNPSFPEFVKIGYADNVDERLAQLNRSECTPFAFRKFAVLHVASRLADKNVHKLIDTYKPELRAREKVNGKMRVREFFSMSPQEAAELLGTIGGIFGETPQIFLPTREEQEDRAIAEEVSAASERKSPFSFYKCGIKKGEQVVYVNDNSVVCTVEGDRVISYQGKKTSLSALAKKLLGRDISVQGTLYFTYNGEVLSALRKRLEDEGKYSEETAGDSAVATAPAQKDETDDDILYFTMQKYKARCRRVNGGYVLLKGSSISSALAKSCREGIKKLREEHAKNISADFILLNDIPFKSSSTAAAFVAGASVNGKICWKNKNGVLLKDILEGENN